MYSIINVKDYPGGLEKAVSYIHSKWGKPENYPFYLDAITHSSESGKPLPRFYLLLKQEEIAGCYALLTNDLISRQDLYPWLGCLFIEKTERGQQLGNLLMQHGIAEAGKLGFATVYLTTDHDGYYEKYGWQRIEDGYDFWGNSTRIYQHPAGAAITI
jgi:GNAT superfamily N-acetyltransferase